MPTTSGGVVDFLIVTALPVELAAVLRHLTGFTTVREPNEPYVAYRGDVVTPAGLTYKVMVTMLNDAGNMETAAVVQRFVLKWVPQRIIMVGVAGGMATEGVSLGDVVVGQKAYYYEPGKVRPDGEQRRPQVFNCDHLLYNRARNCLNNEWTAHIQTSIPKKIDPKLNLGPIAAGEKVFADEQAMLELLKECPKLKAVAMEGAGMGLSAAISGIPFIEVRGVSDLGNVVKNDRMHEFAAEVAAAMTWWLLHQDPITPYTGEPPVPTEADAHQEQLAGSGKDDLSTEEALGEIQGYLETLRERLSALPDFYPERFQLEQIRQKVNISSQRLRYDPEQSRRTEAARRAGTIAEDDIGRVYQPKGREAYTDDEEDIVTVRDWDEVKQEIHNAVILGDPGFGKTWLLKHEGIQAVGELLRRVVAGQVSLSDVVLPVFVRLETLANKLKDTNGQPYLALAQILRDEYGISERFALWVAKFFETGSSLLLLDALDETSGEGPELRLGLDQLAANSKNRIILTSRIVGYLRPPFRFREHDRELELVSFDWVQVQRFVQAWFGKDTHTAIQVLKGLRSKPALRGLARIPLMLSFICLLGPTDIPSRRYELYETVLRSLLERAETEKTLHRRAPAEFGVELKLDVLGQIAWELANYNGSWTDLLSGSEVRRIIREYPQVKECGLGAADRLLTELVERDGVLIRIGDSTPAKTAAPFLFLHRTIAEYLVARRLKSMEQTSQQAHILRHAWFDSDWEEVLVLLAGSLRDSHTANALLDLLLSQKPDVFHGMLCLAGRCVAEAGPAELGADLVQKVRDGLLQMLQSESAQDRIRASHVLAAIGFEAVEGLLTLVDSYTEAVRKAAAAALKEMRDPLAIPPLLAAFNGSATGRAVAGSTLSHFGQPAVKPLVQAAGSNELEVYGTATKALREIRDPLAADDLREALNSPFPNVKASATMALAFLQDKEAARLLLALVGPSTTSNVKLALAYAFGELKVFKAIDILKDLAYIWEEDVRLAAIRALGRLGTADVLPTLAQKLNNSKGKERAEVRRAIRSITDPFAVHGLLDLLKHPSPDVRQTAVRTLSTINTPEAAEAVISTAANDNSVPVRVSAVIGMRSITHPKVKSQLTSALADSSAEVRKQAARGLSLIDATDTLPRLYDMVSNPEETVGVRVYALWAIGDMEGNKATATLLQALKERNLAGPAARVLARWRISIWGLLGALQELPDAEKIPVIWALGELGDPLAVTKLQDELENERPEVRVCAAQALGKLGVATPVKRLVIALTDSTEEVREAAASALGMIVPQGRVEQVCQDLLYLGQTGALDQGDQVRVYELLLQLAPLLRTVVGERWQEWRVRLSDGC